MLIELLLQELLHKLMCAPVTDTFGHGDRQAVEYAAMNAVMDIERELGFAPVDVSAQKCGYDVESTIPAELRSDTGSLRFIEVKGRAKGATTVTVSKNEIKFAETFGALPLDFSRDSRIQYSNRQHEAPHVFIDQPAIERNDPQT